MPAVSLSSLLVQETKEKIYAFALGVARAVGVPVDSWQAGDPTRSLYHVEAEMFATLEPEAVGFIGSGFLDYAHGQWLKIKAQQDFNVVVPAATYATTSEVLTNNGGGVYDFDPGALTFKDSTTGKTYHNSTGGHLAAKVGSTPGTLTVTIVADEAGSASSAGAGEIDAFVSGPVGVTCTNPTAATGTDEQDEATTIQQCRDKLGSFSPNGPRDAYAFVARNSTLTGTSAVTRVRVYPDSTTGIVTIYLAGPSGGVAEPDRALVELAIATYATPLCITPVVLAASNVVVPVTYTLWIYKSCNKTTTDIQAAVSTALQGMFAGEPIGGDIIPPATTGTLYKTLIESTIRGLFPQAFRVSVSAPAGDTALTNGQVATLGTVTPTINLVTDP